MLRKLSPVYYCIKTNVSRIVNPLAKELLLLEIQRRLILLRTLTMKNVLRYRMKCRINGTNLEHFTLQ
jgi:hypothetical protein